MNSNDSHDPREGKVARFARVIRQDSVKAPAKKKAPI